MLTILFYEKQRKYSFNLSFSLEGEVSQILSKFLPIIEHLRRTILSREKIRVCNTFFPGVYIIPFSYFDDIGFRKHFARISVFFLVK
jgi:hypothetical protein